MNFISNQQTCHAGRDGECFWKNCPQLITYEKHCPLDNTCPECLAGENATVCVMCNGTGYLTKEAKIKGPNDRQ